MHLLALPPELRLQIYAFLPELQASQQDDLISSRSSALTPSISRASGVLRAETLPLYARSRAFVFMVDKATQQEQRRRQRLHTWLAALGPANVARVRALQLSRYWTNLHKPVRWQGYAGLYVRLQRRQGDAGEGSQDRWECVAGTFPMAYDPQEARSERVEWLLRVLKTQLSCLRSSDAGGERGDGNVGTELSTADVELAARFIDAVAGHSIQLPPPPAPWAVNPGYGQRHIDEGWETCIWAAVSDTTKGVKPGSNDAS